MEEAETTATSVGINAEQEQLIRNQASESSTYHSWQWKEGLKVHYETAGTEGPPVLLLTGFGVGGFHYERNVAELAQNGKRVWVMDIMGQGSSWPTTDPAPGGGFTEAGFEWGFGASPSTELDAQELTYSCNMWKDQAIAFVESVVGEPCYIAGNSLGGYLAAIIASERPDLCKGIFLMNPTPWWGVGVQRILPWTGGYPVPKWVRPVTIPWWDTIRNPTTIKTLLSQVYADAERVGDRLVQQIIVPTEQPAAASAFASILCSPSYSDSFDQMLEAAGSNGVKVGLCYGKEDPWIVPLWGHRAKRTLPTAEYWEITPAGHCPHHEAPEAVNLLLQDWILRMENGEEAPDLSQGETKTVPRDLSLDQDAVGKPPFTIRLHGAEPRTVVEALDDVWTKFTAT